MSKKPIFKKFWSLQIEEIQVQPNNEAQKDENFLNINQKGRKGSLKQQRVSLTENVQKSEKKSSLQRKSVCWESSANFIYHDLPQKPEILKKSKNSRQKST